MAAMSDPLSAQYEILSTLPGTVSIADKKYPLNRVLNSPLFIGENVRWAACLEETIADALAVFALHAFHRK